MTTAYAVYSPVLPNADLAYVDDAKLTRYLLALDHQVGRGKAGFLRAAGFELTNIHSIRAALLAHAQIHRVADSAITPYGTKYRVDGPLSSPTGQTVHIRTVWQVDAGQTAPRFVTMRPL